LKNSPDEKAMYNSQKFMPTYILIALNIAFYIYTSVAGGDFLNTNINMIVKYGQVNELVIYYGQYYQLLTSMFVHANIAHIAGNMLFLLIFGLRGEEMFSLPEYLLVYFLGGLTGNLLSLLLLPLNVPSVGASGAIFAMFGACTIYARRSVRQSIIGALIYAFFLLLLSSGLDVNNFAHIGGLVTGLLIGYVLATRRKPETRYTIGYSYSKNP
jgi:rhomboid protease GluP